MKEITYSGTTVTTGTVLHRTTSTYLSSVITSRKAMTASTLSLPCFNELTISQHRDPLVPTYITVGKKRGRVLVINNTRFLRHKTERKGAKIDGKNVKKLFKSMGFHVDIFRDKKHTAMWKKVTKFKNDSSLGEVDISIVIIMSHGNNLGHNRKGSRDGFTEVYGIDGKGLRAEDVINQFSAENCPAMAGKPKIFIFQSCRCHQPEPLYHNETPMREMVKTHADMLIAFSTLPNFYSPRDTLQGSWYIQSICDVFEKYAKEFDIEQLLKIVDYELYRRQPTYQQIFTYKSQGFKRCYLNPKYKY